MNFFKTEDHRRIESEIRNRVNCDWLITYDDAPEIEDIYVAYPKMLYDLNYSVSKKCKASELLIFKDSICIPTEESLNQRGIYLNFRKKE